MTVTGVLRKVADAGADTLGRHRHAGLLVAVLLLAGCPGTTGTPGAGLPDPTLGGSARAAILPPVPKVKPVPPATMTAGMTGGMTAGSQVSALPDPLAAAIPDAFPIGPPVTNSLLLPSTPAPSVIPSANPTSTPNADPDALVGLDEVQTLHLLGSPVAREEAPPAKVWRYAKGDCTLKVFFFMDMTSSQDFRALSYDMKSSQNVPDADHRCFAQLLAHDSGAAVGTTRY